jgi:hypothetical protein
MAGFCRNCGSPLGDEQTFCTKCGTRVPGAPSQAPAGAAPPASAAPPVPPPQPAATSAVQALPTPGAPAKGSPLIKILLVVAGVFVLFGAVGIAGLIYVGHRVHKKAVELGLTDSSGHHVSTLSGIDACSLLTKDDVSQAVRMEVVRAEASRGSSPGCVYSVAGDSADLTAKHLSQLTKQMSKDNKQEMTKSQQDAIEKMGQNFFRSTEAQQGSSLSEHAGETPILTFSIDDNAAPFQMKLNRGMLGQLGPMATSNIPDLGDEAFDVAGAVMMARKGDKLVRVMYMTCPCGRDDVLPLVRKIVLGL